MQSKGEAGLKMKPEQLYLKNAGLILIAAGLVFALDQLLHTSWLTLSVMPVLGAIGYIWGLKLKRFAWVIPGALVLGVGLSSAAMLVPLHLSDEFRTEWFLRSGAALILFGISWLAIFMASWAACQTIAWWVLIPGLTILGGGVAFLAEIASPLDFFCYPLLGLGISLLAWGYFEKLLGLIIPGSLIIGIAAGIYFAWSKVTSPSGLAETGIMLVWFALGWVLITLFTRAAMAKFVWWPLIPGGLLAMVGWGLYVGGNPDNALNFIGNTGSVSLILFGVYLLLLKRSFKG